MRCRTRDGTMATTAQATFGQVITTITIERRRRQAGKVGDAERQRIHQRGRERGDQHASRRCRRDHRVDEDQHGDPRDVDLAEPRQHRAPGVERAIPTAFSSMKRQAGVRSSRASSAMCA